jgi:hypothetical protein
LKTFQDRALVFGGSFAAQNQALIKSMKKFKMVLHERKRIGNAEKKVKKKFISFWYCTA